MCDKVLFRLRESKVSAMNKISATSDSPFTFEREEGRGVFMVCQKNWCCSLFLSFARCPDICGRNHLHDA